METDGTLTSEPGETMLTRTLGVSPSGGMSALLSRDPLTGRVGTDDSDELRRLEARFGYGFAALGDRFRSLPEIALGLSDTGRDYSLGWRLVRGSGFGGGSFELSVEAQRRETVNYDVPAERGIGPRMTARFRVTGWRGRPVRHTGKRPGHSPAPAQRCRHRNRIGVGRRLVRRWLRVAFAAGEVGKRAGLPGAVAAAGLGHSNRLRRVPAVRPGSATQARIDVDATESTPCLVARRPAGSRETLSHACPDTSDQYRYKWLHQ